jgi:hypothetical protein
LSLTLFAIAFARFGKKWQGRRDSNPQHPVLETGALPLELLPYAPSLPSTGLLGLFVDGDRIAPLAVLVELDPFGIVALILHSGVITALALLASHRDPDPHYFTCS